MPPESNYRAYSMHLRSTDGATAAQLDSAGNFNIVLRDVNAEMAVMQVSNSTQMCCTLHLTHRKLL